MVNWLAPRASGYVEMRWMMWVLGLNCEVQHLLFFNLAGRENVCAFVPVKEMLIFP